MIALLCFLNRMNVFLIADTKKGYPIGYPFFIILNLGGFYSARFLASLKASNVPAAKRL